MSKSKFVNLVYLIGILGIINIYSMQSDIKSEQCYRQFALTGDSYIEKSILIEELKKRFADIIDCFAGKNFMYPIENFLEPVKLIQFNDTYGIQYNFFGVEDKKQLNVNFSEFKEKVIKLMNIPATKALQLIGDSSLFSKEGSDFARKILREEFDKSNLIEYGYTGYMNNGQLCVNSFITEYLNENPTAAYKVLANIVGHTHVALNEWGTTGSTFVRNFVVVYSNDGMTKKPIYDENGLKISGYTTFGDDIIMSDYILQSKDEDRIICVEGGVQSLRQVMNAVALNIPVCFIYNVRTTERESFLSAARLFKKIHDLFRDNDEIPSKELVQLTFDNYIKSLENVWDRSKPDHLTKKSLFENAIKDFVNKGLYKGINKLCVFYDGSNY